MSNIKKRILVVEDNEQLAGLLKEALGMEGFDVAVATKGDEGLEVALKTHPDLLLLDVLLPGVDGMTILHTLRKDSWWKSVPIIMLTNVSADDNVMKDVLKDEPSYYLIKAESSMDHIVNTARSALNMA